MSQHKGGVQISEIANTVLDPVLARRAGINTTLLSLWGEIVGAEFADCTRPERIKWPRRASQDEAFEPGTLTVACEGARALFLAHSQDQLIQRLNSVFGFPAVNRIKIVQKPVSRSADSAPKPPRLSDVEKQRLNQLLTEIESPNLRQALERLGAGVMGKKGQKQ